MKFSELAHYLQRLEAVPARLEITRILAEMWEALTPDEAREVAYLLRGRVCAQFVSLELGMAEKSVLKALSQGLGVNDDLSKRIFSENGDLGETAQSLKNSSPKNIFEDDLSITQVFQHLEAMAKMTGDGSNTGKISKLMELFQTLDPLSVRYVARIPTSELRLGCSDMTIIDSLSWYLMGDKSLNKIIEAAFQVRPDLGEIARLIRAGNIDQIKKISPVLFTPVRMMRAQRADSGSDILSHSQEVLVEPKYDGLRLQVHVDKNSGTVKIFSRGLEEVTDSFPDIVKNVLAAIKVRTAIIEGEAVGFDPVTKLLVQFQQTVTRKRKYEIETVSKQVPLRLHIFDILLADDEILMNSSFLSRRAKLETLFDFDENLCVLAPQTLEQKADKIEKMFDEAISSGLEGIMAKIPADPYRAGARGWSWMKLKMSYSAKMTDTLDCLVMGFDRGRGKRSGFGAGAFLVGILDEKLDKFVTVAKIGTGLTDEEWRRIASLEKDHALKSCPQEYEVDKLMSCDIWLRPAVVVEIRADEITRSQMHTAGRKVKVKENGTMEVIEAGYALRFPRLEKWREDKNPKEVTALVELQEIAK